MKENLQSKAVSGLFWKSITLGSQRGIQVVITIFLARLLAPEEFGLLAMLTVFIEFSMVIITGGFGQALIQKKDVTDADYSTVFYINLGVSTVLYIAFYYGAPFIASFYSQEELIPLTRFIMIGLIFNALGLVQNSILVKSINFKDLTKINISATTLSGILGVILAIKGYGVWSLAIQAVSQSLFRTILLWYFSTWNLKFQFSKSSFVGLFGFGSKLLVSGLLNSVYSNIYLVIIGKFFTATALGYFTQAKKLQMMPVKNINSLVQSVTFPTFSMVQDDQKKLRKGYEKSLVVLAFLNFPLMAILIITAEPLIRILLTEKWIPSVLYFQLLCVIGILYPIHSLNINIIKVKGFSGLVLKLNILKKILITASVTIVLFLEFGIIGLLIGEIILSVSSLFVNSYFSGKLIGYSTKDQLLDFSPYLLISVVAGVVAWGIHLGIESNGYQLILAQVVGFTMTYLCLGWIINFEAFRYIRNILTNVRAKQRS